MRKGVNPEKYKEELNTRYFHRIVVPIYIPNVEEEYYKNTPGVLEHCLDSLITSINPETTAITVINNNSTSKIDAIIERRAAHFDKVIKFTENKGKVYPLVHEARACYEPFITLVDSDVLFLKGWEQAVFSVFSTYHKAAVVAPLPSPGLAFKHNSSIFALPYLLGKIKHDKIINEVDCNLYLEGLGNPSLLTRNNRLKSWTEAHYFLNKEPKAIVGAGHFVATYKSDIFKEETLFPSVKFKNGYEDEFIDVLADKKGGYRLSTVETFAYHMGNNLDENIKTLSQGGGPLLQPELIAVIPTKLKPIILPYFMRKFVFKVIKKLKKL